MCSLDIISHNYIHLKKKITQLWACDNIFYFIVHPDVPIPGADGCPKQTKGCNGLGCPNTCYCEDRCTWERCTLLKPPEECLRDTNSTWKLGDEHWTAKYTGWYLTVIGCYYLTDYYGSYYVDKIYISIFRFH